MSSSLYGTMAAGFDFEDTILTICLLQMELSSEQDKMQLDIYQGAKIEGSSAVRIGCERGSRFNV